MHREDTRTAADADTFARLREALEQQAAKAAGAVGDPLNAAPNGAAALSPSQLSTLL
jgi:hypothetical protein